MNNLISSKEAAKVIGVSEVMLCKWRKRGTGPTVYAGAGRFKFGYDKAECIRFARDRMPDVERIRDLETRVEELERAMAAMRERMPPRKRKRPAKR